MVNMLRPPSRDPFIYAVSTEASADTHCIAKSSILREVLREMCLYCRVPDNTHPQLRLKHYSLCSVFASSPLFFTSYRAEYAAIVLNVLENDAKATVGDLSSATPWFIAK